MPDLNWPLVVGIALILVFAIWSRYKAIWSVRGYMPQRVFEFGACFGAIAQLQEQHGLYGPSGRWAGERAGIQLPDNVNVREPGRALFKALRELTFRGLLGLDRGMYFLNEAGLDYCSRLDCSNVPLLK